MMDYILVVMLQKGLKSGGASSASFSLANQLFSTDSVTLLSKESFPKSGS